LLIAGAAIGQAADFSAAVVAEMNLARTQPQAYAQILSERMGAAKDGDVAEAVRFLEKATPLPKLALSPGMSRGAKLHVDDVGPKGKTGHSGTDRSTPFTRMNQFGQYGGMAGENIYYGKQDARGIICALIVDSGVRGRGHRKNIFNDKFALTGVAHGGHTVYGTMCVMNFAASYTEKAAEVAGL
jgi:uncharacterized protein YkwD